MTMVWFWMAAASDVKACHLFISLSPSVSFTLPDSLSLSLSLIKVMERSYESQGRWSAVSCCHWPRTRRICRDRQYARAGQKLIPWIIKAKEKSTEDVALLRRKEEKKKNSLHMEAQSFFQVLYYGLLYLKLKLLFYFFKYRPNALNLLGKTIGYNL